MVGRAGVVAPHKRRGTGAHPVILSASSVILSAPFVILSVSEGSVSPVPGSLSEGAVAAGD